MLAKHLTPWDTIAIIAPSSKVGGADRQVALDKAVAKLEWLGFNVILSPNCLKVDKFGVSAGEPQERVDDLHDMFNNPEIKAIYCAHGWDTANQMLPLIDFDTIKNNPKIFLWMSDVDVLHLAINTMTDLIVFHGSDPKSGRELDLDIDYTRQNFQDRMIQKSKVVPASSERICVRDGHAEGKLLGCNLSSILKLAGTPYFPNFDWTVLFLEGYSENTKKAISKLQQLKEIGVFDKIKWIVIGYVVGFQDKERIEANNIQCNYEDVVLEITKDYDFPILKTNDFGHRCPNAFLPIGARIKMDTTAKNIEIVDDFLE